MEICLNKSIDGRRALPAETTAAWAGSCLRRSVWLVALAGAPALWAGANLVVMPTRVILEGRTRAAEVNLINNGDAPGVYRVSFTDSEMNGQGELRDRLEPPWSAKGLVRHAPRTVTLAPGASQVVRLQVRKPEGLPEGEYRSHLLFQAVPNATPAAEAGQGLAMEVQAVMAVSIPVFVRHGALTGACALENPALSPDRRRLTVTIARQGPCSTYGDLVATWTPATGKPVQVGRANGVAVYGEITRVLLGLDLHLPATEPAVGRLTLAYCRKDNGKPMAEVSLGAP